MQNHRFGRKAVKPGASLADLQQDLAAVASYAEQYGSFSDLVRDHYERLEPPDEDRHDPAGVAE
jgi:hypothetical protein